MIFFLFMLEISIIYRRHFAEKFQLYKSYAIILHQQQLVTTTRVLYMVPFSCFVVQIELYFSESKRTVIYVVRLMNASYYSLMPFRFLHCLV